ncbi:MarR family transcriptional regulator, partial [Streptomyces spiralis]
AGLIERTRDPRDPRAVQLALTEQGQAVTRQAIAVVQGLLQQLLEPLGGLNAPRTRAFTDDLTALLDVPLAPSVPNDQSTQGTTP